MAGKLVPAVLIDQNILNYLKHLRMESFTGRFYFASGLLLFVLAFSACCKTADCARGYTHVTFVGWSIPTAYDTFYLRRYRLNTNFSDKLDTVIYIKNKNYEIVKFRGDSAVVSPIPFDRPKSYFIDEGYDYELVVPATGKISRITEVIEENFEEKFCGMARRSCYTSIRSVKVDGEIFYGTAVVKK